MTSKVPLHLANIIRLLENPNHNHKANTYKSNW